MCGTVSVALMVGEKLILKTFDSHSQYVCAKIKQKHSHGNWITRLLKCDKWYIYQKISIISIVSKTGYPRQLPVCPPLPTGFSPAWWTFTGPSNPWPGSTPPTPTCSRWPSCPSSSLRYKHRGPGAETGDLHRAQAVLTTWRGSTTHTASRGRRPRPPRGRSETRGCCAPPARLQHKMLRIPFVTWPSLVCSF